IVLTLGVVVALTRLGANVTGDANLAIARHRHFGVGVMESVFNATCILLALICVAGPMAAIVISGLEADLGRLVGEAGFRRALVTSLALAVTSASLAAVAAWALAAARWA